MYRVLFVVGLVVLVGLQTLFVTYAVQSNLTPVALEDTDISLQRSTSLIEKSHRLDEFALKEKAEFVAAGSDLRESMVLDNYEGDDPRGSRHIEVFERLDAQKVRFEEFWAEEVDGLRNLDRDLKRRHPLELEMFIALDEDGRLVATVAEGPARSMGDDFGGQFSKVHEVMDNNETAVDMWNWAWRAEDDRELYVVSIAPIQHPDGEEVVGTVVLGYQVTDGVAERRRSLVADGLGEDEPEGEEVDAMSPRQQVQAPDLLFFRGERVYSSTLSGRDRRGLAEELFDRHEILDHEEPQKILDTSIPDGDHRTMVRFFPGQFETDNPAGVVVTTSHDQAIAPFNSVRNNVITAGVLTLGAAIIFVLALFYFFIKPFGRLEEGIQQILSGDKDYSFETGVSHDIADNLAHHLNLLSAYLQGKPMPDEEQSVGGWEGFDTDTGDAGGGAEAGDAEVAGVPMDFGAGGDSEDSDDPEDEDDDTEKPGQSEGDQTAGEPT